MGIHFWIATEGPVVTYLESKVDEWNKSHLECQVKIQNTASDRNYGVPAQVALGKPGPDQPSLVLAPEFMTSSLMTAIGEKKIIPVYDILHDAQLQKIATLVQKTFGDSQGRAVSLPLNPACGVIYTNKQALEKAGIDREYVPQTMEELEELCRKMVKLGIVEKGYTTAWPPAYLIEIPAAQRDAPVAEPDNGFSGKGNYTLSSEWLKNHLLDIRRQAKEGIYVYAGPDNNAKKPFIENKVAFYMQGSSHAEFLQKEAKFDVGYGPLPTLERGQSEKHALPLGGASIWVLDNEQTRRALDGVRGFLDYLASDEVQEGLHKTAVSVPVSQSLPQKLEEFYKDHPLHRAVVAQTIEATLGDFSYGIRMPNYAAARKELFTLIEKFVDEKTTDEEAVALLQKFDAEFSLK